MIELVRTGDPVLVSWLDMIFRQRGIKMVVFDEHTSTAYGGALSLISRRIVVDEGDLDIARQILHQAEGLADDE
ncbi:MAG: DUF2007 domain-containing protein [Rhodospirillales bacterium]